MALVKCSECGKKISDKSKKCNGCGAPIKEDDPKTRKRMIIGLIIVIALYFVGKSVYNRYFDYHKEYYCDNSEYKLSGKTCYKYVTSDPIGYKCDDEEHYSLEDSYDNCRLKEEFITEPIVTEKCSDGFVLSNYFNEYTNENQMLCWGQTNRGYGGITPTKDYSCPENYTFKYVTIGSTGNNPMCISNILNDVSYQVKSTPVCPEGYNYEVVGHKTNKRSGGYCFGYGDSRSCYEDKTPYSSVITTEDVMGCGKYETVEANYKKVHN